MYVVGAGVLYFRPLFNASAYASLFLAAVLISLWWAEVAGYPYFFAVIVSCIFVIILGIKNLILTHREWWARVAAYGLSYFCLILFFMHGATAYPFWLVWILLMVIIGLVWQAVIKDNALLLPALIAVGELAWVTSWLPIGFLASANVIILTMLFVDDGYVEGRYRWKNLLLFAGLIAVVLTSSYWTLDA